MPRISYNRKLGRFRNAVTQFETDILDFEAETERQHLSKTKKLAEYAFRRVLELTPVDTYDTRNRWKVSLDTPTSDDSPSKSALSDGLAIIKSAQYGQNIIIINNSVVMEIIEHGLFSPPDPGPSKDPRPERKGKILVSGGYSTQAPQGVVSVVVNELELFLE